MLAVTIENIFNIGSTLYTKVISFNEISNQACVLLAYIAYGTSVS